MNNLDRYYDPIAQIWISYPRPAEALITGVTVITADGVQKGTLYSDDTLTVSASVDEGLTNPVDSNDQDDLPRISTNTGPGDAGMYALWDFIPDKNTENCLGIITGIPKGVTETTLMGVLLLGGFATMLDRLKPEGDGTDMLELPWHIIMEECREMERGRRGPIVDVTIEYRTTAKFTLPGRTDTVDSYMKFFPKPVPQMMEIKSVTWKCLSAEEVGSH